MKVIKAIMVRISSFIHCLFVKIWHPFSFSFHAIEMISASTHFTIQDKGKISIGKKCGMRRGCELTVSEKGRIAIGNQCFFNKGCIIASHQSIVIGNKTRFGPNVMVYDHDYDFKNSDQKKRDCHVSDSIIIGNNVWIGAGVIILRGTEIGDNCVVAAGCILKGKYPEGTMVVQKKETEVRKIIYKRECENEACTTGS